MFNDATQVRKYCAANAILQAAASIMEERIGIQSDIISDIDGVKLLLRTKFAIAEREHFGIIALNARNRPIALEVLFSGTLTQTSIYPREVIKRALELNALSLIIFHNHPSGETKPSDADKAITTQLGKACDLVGIRLLDHIVVSAVEAFSFAENALL